MAICRRIDSFRIQDCRLSKSRTVLKRKGRPSAVILPTVFNYVPGYVCDTEIR